MSFIDKVKSWFNIGGVKLAIDVPVNIEKASQEVKGSIKVTSKTDKHVEKITVKLVETFSQGRGESASERDYDWGEKEISSAFDIKTGEEKVVEFVLPFTPVKSSTESMADQGGVLGGLGKVAMFADNAKSTFKVEASAKITGSAFGTSESKEVKLV